MVVIVVVSVFIAIVSRSRKSRVHENVTGCLLGVRRRRGRVRAPSAAHREESIARVGSRMMPPRAGSGHGHVIPIRARVHLQGTLKSVRKGRLDGGPTPAPVSRAVSVGDGRRVRSMRGGDTRAACFARGRGARARRAGRQRSVGGGRTRRARRGGRGERPGRRDSRGDVGHRQSNKRVSKARATRMLCYATSPQGQNADALKNARMEGPIWEC